MPAGPPLTIEPRDFPLVTAIDARCHDPRQCFVARHDLGCAGVVSPQVRDRSALLSATIAPRSRDLANANEKAARAGEEPLFTVVIGDAAVRSTLVARLAMNGADMCTGQSLGEGRPASARNAAAILVTDQSTIDMHPGGAGALLRDLPWHSVMVLTSDTAAISRDSRLIYVEHKDAVPAITRLRIEAQRGR